MLWSRPSSIFKSNSQFNFRVSNPGLGSTAISFRISYHTQKNKRKFSKQQRFFPPKNTIVRASGPTMLFGHPNDLADGCGLHLFFSTTTSHRQRPVHLLTCLVQYGDKKYYWTLLASALKAGRGPSFFLTQQSARFYQDTNQPTITCGMKE